MTPEEALGRVARAKENMVMAQKNLKELWALWMERHPKDSQLENVLDDVVSAFGKRGQEAIEQTGLRPKPDKILDVIIERLELALTDVKTVRDNLKAGA